MENTFLYANRTLNDFVNAIDQYGWVVYEEAITLDFIDSINLDLNQAIETRRKIQLKNGIGASMEGALHHLLERDNFGIKFLEALYCHAELTQYFGGDYILNGMNAVMLPNQAHPYLSNIHRDVRTFTGKAKLLLQMIVTLDDFTLANGATYFLSGSHKLPGKPSGKDFFERSNRATTQKGSIILFNSNIWHAAGENTTSAVRRALTLGFTPPFVKQQFDYGRFLGYDFVSSLTPWLKQVIGYNARIPENVTDF